MTVGCWSASWGIFCSTNKLCLGGANLFWVCIRICGSFAGFGDVSLRSLEAGVWAITLLSMWFVIVSWERGAGWFSNLTRFLRKLLIFDHAESEEMPCVCQYQFLDHDITNFLIGGNGANDVDLLFLIPPQWKIVLWVNPQRLVNEWRKMKNLHEQLKKEILVIGTDQIWALTSQGKE